MTNTNANNPNDLSQNTSKSESVSASANPTASDPSLVQRVLKPEEFDRARAELAEMAQRGMQAYYHVRHEFEVVLHKMYQRSRDSIFDFLPREKYPDYRTPDADTRLRALAVAQQGSDKRRYDILEGPKDSVFGYSTIMQILPMCFTEDAVKYLIQHTYNKFLFWEYIDLVVAGIWQTLFRVDTVPLPYTLEIVRQRITEEYTPFGLPTSHYSDMQIARLRAAVAAQGDTFDPNKLDAAYAYELIRHNFLLRQKLEDWQQPSILVVNPMWAHLLTEMGVKPQSDKQATLAASGQITGNMTIEAVDVYTVQQIALMLSQRQAQISGSEIIVPCPPPAEGSTVIGHIIGNWYGPQSSTLVWNVIR